MKRKPVIFLVIAFMLCLNPAIGRAADNSLTIAAGSEIKQIEHIIQECARKSGCKVRLVYQGSVDMMLDLQKPDFPYDAVLPANSLWIRLGDKKLRRVSEEASVMRTPVVLGVKTSLAQKLGWIGKDVKVSEILNAIRAKQLTFAMTSATQSNSGASAYMGLLFALAGKPDMITSEHLGREELQKDIKDIFSGVDRSSGSSGWLKDMFIKKYDSLDAMFNYEAMVIAANRELVKNKKEPLYVIYPADGLAIADSTLAFVSTQKNADKKALFIKFRDCLLSPEMQDKIFTQGFRTGLIGMNPENADTSVFNPDWGIDLARVISPIPWPDPEVTEEALRLYQTSFRKPSYTAYLLDISGSMGGGGLDQLKQAMTGLLDQKSASQYLLEASADDVHIVIAFDDGIANIWRVSGNNPDELSKLIQDINNLRTRGGTNIYLPITRALSLFRSEGERIQRYLPAIILMTDGKSGGNLNEVKAFWKKLKAPFELPPIFGVTFGDADPGQLNAIAQYSAGRVFDGKKQGLVKAFREVKGYN
jgi:Ca-activated chloride channel family protein